MSNSATRRIACPHSFHTALRARPISQIWRPHCSDRTPRFMLITASEATRSPAGRHAEPQLGAKRLNQRACNPAGLKGKGGTGHSALPAAGIFAAAVSYLRQVSCLQQMNFWIRPLTARTDRHRSLSRRHTRQGDASSGSGGGGPITGMFR